MMLISTCFYAQETYTLSGVVTSKGDNSVLPGVTVRILKTTKGTETDFDGKYTIKVKKGDVLEFSYLGYASQTVIVVNQKTLNIDMAEDASVLDEVVIIGYGSQRKSHLTGSISKVKNEKLDQIAVSRVDDALVGQVSGVNIQASEGEAGSAPTIRIRGTGSISAGAGPLVVVDGVPLDSDFLGNIDMNDVASFEVLKDAASSAIYGSRGANGVIMITTKEGKEGKTRFTYNTFTGFKTARQSEAYHTSLAGAAAEEAAYNTANGITPVLSLQTQMKQLLGVDNNWQDIIFDGGTIKSHSFAARGGSAKTKYSASLGLAHDEGVLLTDDYKKYNLKLRVRTQATDRLSISANLSPSYTNRRRFDGSTHDILRQPSWLPIRLDAHTVQYVNRLRDGGKFANAQIGDYAQQRMFDDYDFPGNSVVDASGNFLGVADTSGTDISNTSNTNPYAKIAERNRKEYRFKLAGSIALSYKITDDLTFNSSLLGSFQDTRRVRWQGLEAHRNGASNIQLDESSQRRIRMGTDNYLAYNKDFGKHSVNATLGASIQQTKTDFAQTTGTGYSSDLIQTLNGATTITGTGYNYEDALNSFFGRVNYVYDDKYLVSLSLTRDGSSVFGIDTKYGNFPAASLGWILSKEDFLSDSEVVSQLKVRMSYGTTGTNVLNTVSGYLTDNYPSLALLAPSSYVVDGSVQTGFNPANIANPGLQWERSIEINPGVDFGLFNNIVSGSLDYYSRTSDQLLLDSPVSLVTGFNEALVNKGKVENSGIELELRTRNISKENFSWRSTFLASKNKNELIDFGDANGQITDVDSKRAAQWINLEGNPISSFYGYVVDKEIAREHLHSPHHPIGEKSLNIYVKDLNGDGLIDSEDKTILGNPYPDLVWSLTNDFTIGNFDISVMFQGSHGAQVRNIADEYIFNFFDSANVDYIPSTPNQQFLQRRVFTNDIVQDASYIALRNINIGYTFPESVTNKLHLSKLRLYATGQNLVYKTAAGYTGFNPEAIRTTSPTTYGYQRGGSPIQQTITLGLNLQF